MQRINRRVLLRMMLMFLVVFWIGSIVGVSLIATLAKFQAPSLSFPVALEVGKHTFNVFNRVEWGVLCALAVLIFFTQKSPFIMLTGLLLLVLLTLQTVWLLPSLSARADAVVNGVEQLAPSSLHIYYVAVEGVKLLALGILYVYIANASAQQDVVHG